MKGVYLTQTAKQSIEDRIAELKQLYKTESLNASLLIGREIEVLGAILSSAKVIPIHKFWADIVVNTLAPFYETQFPDGVIIEPKNKES
jgi:hypothetical protein